MSFSVPEIDAMAECKMFDHFLEKCQEGRNLSEMLEEQLSVFKRDLIQGSDFTNGPDGVDNYSTDHKRPQVIITGLKPVCFGMITQIFPGKNDKDRYSTVIGTADKPTLIASLLEWTR